MALALLRKRWPLQLRADFQQFYGLNIDEMGLAYGRRHAADLAVMLPRESRTVRAEHPELEWGEAEYLLAVIADAARDTCWGVLDSRRSSSNRPRPLPRPGQRQGTDAAEGMEMTPEEYLELLETIREGGADGQ